MASTSSSTFCRPCFVQWVLRRGNHSVSVCPVLIGLSPSICRQGGDGLCVAAMATDRVNERERAETMTLGSGNHGEKNVVPMTAFYLTAVDSFSQRVTNYLSLDPQHQTIKPPPRH
ncbi:unnamed protein product [Leuciscus chuanchicus]